MRGFLVVGLLVTLAFAGCKTYTEIPDEDLVPAPGERIPLTVGIFDLHTSHIGRDMQQVYNEDKGKVVQQAKKLMEAIFDRVDENPRLPDTDVCVALHYTTELKDNVGYCRGKAVFYKAFRPDKIAEFYQKVTHEGSEYDRLDVIRYNSVLKAQVELVRAMRGHEALRAYALSLGRTLEPTPQLETKTQPAAQAKPTCK